QRHCPTTLAIHLRAKDVPYTNPPLRHASHVRVRRTTLDRVPHEETRSRARQRTGVPDLPARFGIEGRAIEYHLALLSVAQLIHRAVALEQRDHPALRLQSLVALESRARIH